MRNALCICALVVFLACGPAGFSQERAPAPPQPSPVEIQCNVGEQVVIPLTGQSRSTLQLEFLIRSQPKLGELSAVQITGKNTAAVIYRHSGENGEGDDVFTYAVRAPDTAVSARAKVRIAIREPPPVAEAPAEIKFPETAVGETSERYLDIRNRGGGIFSGRLDVPAPWSVEGNEFFAVPGGKTQRFKLVFAPRDAGGAMEKIVLSENPEVAVRLRGTARDLFDVNPSKLELRQIEGDLRGASFELTNRGRETYQVAADAPTGCVITPSKTRLEPGKAALFQVQTAPGMLKGVKGEAIVRAGAVKLELPVVGYPAPPRLEVSPEGALDFGKLRPGNIGSQSVTLKNAGGSEARPQFKLPQDFTVRPDPTAALLEPGASRTFRIEWEPTRALADGAVAVISLAESTVQIPLNGAVLGLKQAGQSGEKEVPPLPSPTPPPFETLAHPTPIPGGNSIPPIRSVKVLDRGRDWIEIAWGIPSPEAMNFIVEEWVFGVTHSGVLVKGFKPMAHCEMERQPQRVVARISNLRPGELKQIQIVSLDVFGTRSEPSDLFALQLPVPRPFRMPWWGWVVLLIPALAAAWLGWRKLRGL